MRKTRAPAPRRATILTSWAHLPVVLDVHTVAILLDVSEVYVRRALQNGDLPGGKIGREWRVDRDKLKAIVEGSATR